MTVDLSAISRRLEISPDELMKKSILSFVAHQVRQAEWDMSDIKDRFGVSSASELEDQIKSHAVHSHPAWEDLIRWENRENYVYRLRAIEEELRPAA